MEPSDDEFRGPIGELADAERLARSASAIDFDALTEGRGTIDTRMVVRVLPSAVVAAMLPRGLQLAPQPLVGPARHPVFLSFAHHRFEAWFGVMDYHELLFGIPWVEYAEERMPHRGPFIYMPRLLLDGAVPQVLGERIYGYEKLAGVFSEHGDTWRVADRNGDAIAKATFASAGEARAPDGWPRFAWVRKLLEMPTISQHARRFDRDARIKADADQRFVGSTVQYLLAGADWDGVPVQPTIEPITASIELGDAIAVPDGLAGVAWAAPSIADDVLGAFRLRTKQIVSAPGDPADARHPPGGGRKLSIAVLGGGPAACAAAYWLARQPDAYDVSLYTMGWRLGGKCAAGRNPDAHDRIEEHGLHAFLGFYRNAIRTVAAVYETAGRSIATEQGPVAGAFRSQEDVGVVDRWADRWHYFPTPMGANERTPGRVPPGGQDSRADLAIAFSGLLRRVAGELEETADDPDADPLDRVFALVSRPWREAMASVVAWLDREGDIALERFVETPPAASRTKTWMIAILQQVRSSLAWYYEARTRTSRSAWFRWGGLDTLLTIAIGLLVDSTLDLDDLDDQDLIAWLLAHGLADEHADISTITQVYETLFAHAPDLPYRTADLACGVGLRWFLLVSFGYDGAPAYDFRWSCPETLMTPYCEALVACGAKVHFFHRVTGLEVQGQGDAKQLRRVRMQIQATTKHGTYDPFVPGIAGPGAPPVWPTKPRFEQLEQGEELARRGIDLEDVYADWSGVGERVLEQGVDFDACILGIPLGALPPLVSPLVDPASPTFDPRWQRMIEGVSLIQTVSAQLWFDREPNAMFDTSLAAVEGEARRGRGLLTGFAHPQGSLGQMTELIAIERWPAPPPALLTYHTGALVAGAKLPAPDATTREFPASERARWRAIFEHWLRTHHASLFDGGPRDFAELLAALRVPAGITASGLERLWTQALTIACQPSDLYVLSRPGETKHRLAPHDSGVRYLLLAGDWTKTDLNCGCVEAATQSGMLAARALSNEPRYVWRVGY
jgi:uncharacterized protein with NAD-binding domain and iron-sulfur cluster